MHIISQVDAQIIAEIRRCLKDTTDRGLIVASKWLSELLLSIPAFKRNTGSAADMSSVSMNISEELDDQPNWRNREELDAEEQDTDVLDVARKCMEARQYHRAMYFLQGHTSAKARFISVYCRFITSEKKALHDWHKTDNTRHQPPLPVNTEINDLLDFVKNSTDPWLQFLEALFLYRLSRIPEALDLLYHAISINPWNWAAWTLLGQCLDSSKALTDALTNIDLPLDHPLPQMFQIKIMNELHTATDVELQLCDRLLGTDYFPDNLWLMGQRGRALYDTLELTKAETQFEKMFTLHPDRIEDLDVYSNILHLRGSREKLTALAEKFLLIDKNRPEVCCIVGNHYSLRSERDKAVKYFRRATHLDRTCLTAWILMGLEYHELANYPAAIESFRKAIDVNKKDSRPWAGLGAAYDAMGMPQYGLFYYQQAMKLRPCESYIWEGLGSCYEQLAKHRDSIFALERAIELSKASVPSNRKIVIRAKIVKLARLVGDKEETLAQELKFIKICDDELFGVNLRPPRDNLAEQYITCVYSVAEYHESNDGNLKLAYDYYNWLFVLDPSTVRAKPTMREQIKSKASAKGYDLTNTNSLQFGYSLDYKKGRCLLLEFLQQTGQVTDV
ncbi:cell division control protein 23 [Lentinula edodes]|nr:cell division control protein 23 [Lentinula edodes]